MRVIDILLAFPWLLLAIGIMAILGPGIKNVIIAVAIIYIPAFARIVRGSVLSIKEKEYVEAARAIGQPDRQIIIRHVLANAWAPIIVLATLSIGQAIIYAAGLSFIGLGTQPPDADWGVMLTSGHEYLRDAPLARLLPRSRDSDHRAGIQSLRRRAARRARSAPALKLVSKWCHSECPDMRRCHSEPAGEESRAPRTTATHDEIPPASASE